MGFRMHNGEAGLRSETKALTSKGMVTLGLVVAALVILGWGQGSAAAQTDCTLDLAEARVEYEVGRFQRVVDLLEPCTTAGGSHALRADSRVWRAKAFIALDEIELAAAEVQILIQIRPSYEPSTAESLAFQNLVLEAKAGGGPRVTSVSKKPELLREAPATVQRISGEEIRRRGYQDLVAYLKDIPGFDMATTNGILYSTIYPRGYRAENTNRFLILIDGVEDNGLWTSNVWLSRQYSLSNIDSVEVVYGPSSTMYGANAFLGVINIITLTPRALLQDGRKFGLDAQITYGSWNTKVLDFTLAGKSDTLGFSYSLTGRTFQSEEFNPSGFPAWDYALDDLDFYRSKLTISGDEAVDAFLDANCGEGCDPYDNGDFVLVEDGGERSIVPTDFSANKAREFDRTALGTEVQGAPVGRWSGNSDDWYLYGKIQSGFLTLGMQMWRREEGGGTWFNDWRFSGTDNGTLWVPQQFMFYANYERPVLSNRLFLQSFTRYKTQQLDQPTGLTQVKSYWNGRGGRNLGGLLSDTPSSWSTTYFYEGSSQLREELKAVWIPNANFDLVTGLEFRFGDLQGDFIQSSVPNPQENGFAGSTTQDNQTIPGKNSFSVRDIGLYSQVTYRPWEDWKFTLGGRFDNNKIGSTGGYGSVFNLRTAAVYTPGDFTFKAIYAEAFKDASNREKFSSIAGFRIANPTLQPEKVENIDLTAAWDPNEDLHLDIVYYDSSYSQVLQAVLVEVDGQIVTQNQAIGRLGVQGIQANASYRMGEHKAYANFTFTDPENLDTGERISDIADVMANFGVDLGFFESFFVSLRGNWVGSRKVGAGTTVASNPLTQIDSFIVFNGAVTYELPVTGLEAILTINNILNEEYYHPGIRTARSQYPAQHIQPDRSYFLKIRYTY